MGKILKEKKLSKNAILNNLNSIYNAEPHRSIAKLSDARIGGMIKSEFKHKKDVILINRYNDLLKKTNNLLYKLLKRVILD